MNILRGKPFLAFALAMILAVGGATAWHAGAQGTATVQAGNALSGSALVDIFFQTTKYRLQLADNLSSGELAPQVSVPGDNGVIFTTGVSAKKSVMIQSGRTYCAIVANDASPRIEFVDVTSKVGGDPAKTEKVCQSVLNSLLGGTVQPTQDPGDVSATSTPTLSPVEPTPEPVDECDAVCREKAEQVYQACLSNGGAADECRLKADHYYEQCVVECRFADGDPSPTATQFVPTQAPTATTVPPTATRVPPTATSVPPTKTSVPRTATSVPPTAVPPAEDCASICIAEYETFYAECLAAGGDAQLCAQRAKIVYYECLANCK